MLNVYKIAIDTKIYGVGKRTAIWFQGCSIRCKGCINPHLWSFVEKNLISPKELAKSIAGSEVTLLGGEPLDQADILEFIKELKLRDIGIILFTGYSLTNLKGDKLTAVQLCDAVISEPFELSLEDPHLYLRGSSNQVLTLNSERYSLEDFNGNEAMEVVVADGVEVRGRQTSRFLWDMLTTSFRK
jgi:anaerobic ribonucleoside-triphosphate reductase activating protein